MILSSMLVTNVFFYSNKNNVWRNLAREGKLKCIDDDGGDKYSEGGRSGWFEDEGFQHISSFYL